MAKRAKITYVCDNCGYESPKWLGKCPNCQEWNTFEEMAEVKESPRRETDLAPTSEVSQALPLNKIIATEEDRIPTQMAELDRVFGGGIVPGSLTLIGGDPGIGKSTLMLQVSMQIQDEFGPVLYVSGEESTNQIKMRADRLEVVSDQLYILAETDLRKVFNQIEVLKPKLVVIDSIQTMVHPEVNGMAGSVSQVRESTAQLLRLAKSQQVSILIVGHVTKEGNIAGPRMLEHMVDTVLYFEGEKYNTYRILRAVKNRFGSTNEIGVFEMLENGLKEVSNPSEMFLDERLTGANGSAVVASLEGTRVILVEIQSLISPTAFGNARRTASGIDHNRLSLIMAVLEKRSDLMLQNQDAYLKLTGGVRLDEPALDLGIAISIASSYFEKGTDPLEAFVGEIGLTGEIRRVSHANERVKEAAKLGFKRIYLPKTNTTGLKVPDSIEVVGVSTLKEVIQKVFR